MGMMLAIVAAPRTGLAQATTPVSPSPASDPPAASVRPPDPAPSQTPSTIPSPSTAPGTTVPAPVSGDDLGVNPKVIELPIAAPGTRNQTPPPPTPSPYGPPTTRPGTPAPPVPEAVVPDQVGSPGDKERPRTLQIQMDQRNTSGLLPLLPPGRQPTRPTDVVNKQLSSIIERIQEPEGEIVVTISTTKVIQTRKLLTRIAIAQPSIADVEILNDQPNSRLIQILGRSFGTTTLTLWDETDNPVTFLVRVTLDTLDLEARIKQIFPGALIHIRQVGPQLILEGQVPDSKTMSDVLDLIRAELRNSGRSQQQGSAGQAQAAAQGAAQGAAAAGAPPQAAAQGAAQGASQGSALSMTIINRVRVPGPRQVMLHVKIAELNRTAIRQLGVSWLDPKNNAILASTIGGAAGIAATAGAPSISQSATTNARGMLSPIKSTFGSSASATPNNAQLFGIFNAGQFSLFLNALRSNSIAKILAEPNLMAMDGQPARFLAGGLFPYPVPQSSSIPGGTAVVTVQFANFGAILSFLPNILQNDEIQLDVEPVFSQLNFGAGTTINGGQVPAIDQRSARTVVRLREGQTLAIAGLLQNTTNATTQRVPLLGDLPIVGPLFSSNFIETVETELVVLVTPELVAPMEANEVPPAPGDRVFQPNDYEFYFLGRIEGKLGHEFRSTVRELDPFDIMKHYQSENYWVVGPHGHAD
jgi:pilus assembly protein CpaC